MSGRRSGANAQREAAKEELMGTAIGQQADGAWTQLKGRVQEAWGALTDSDIDRYEGKIDQLAGFISQKTGEARETIAEKLNALSNEIKR
jgi:uncharacterized protein YjbJ (UPF0337 family)